ncbi:DUF3892 domain-containing protein [Agrobacterium sp. S2]|nr:DUF3892 domain-containing protein [Agrobacterium sp. S2]
MSIRITAIRLSDTRYNDHQHITEFRWTGYEDGNNGQSSKQQLVEWIDSGGRAYVESGSGRVSVGVVKPSGGTPYLRTVANGTWTDNLLSLPHF